MSKAAIAAGCDMILHCNGKMPEMREVAAAVPVLAGEASRRAIVALGAKRPARSIDIPLAGRIAAGAPVEAIEGQDTLQFADFAGKGDTFALQVTGESMIDDHILSGDYVLVERAQQAQDGEIVVALVDGHEATLKCLYHEPDGRIRLQPANASMQPIFVDAASVQVQGRVLAVLRKYK